MSITYSWINDLDYGGHSLSWVQAWVKTKDTQTQEITTKRFVYPAIQRLLNR